MRTLYIDCGMGAAGDMLMGALLELLPDADAFVDRLNGLAIPDVRFCREQSVKCGIVGTHMSVRVHGVEEGEDIHHGHDREHHHGHDEHGAEHHHGYGEHGIGHHHEHGVGSVQRQAQQHAHPHHHSGMREIERIITELHMPEGVRDDVLAVYRLIAQAESHAHAMPVSDIHFHEVGTMDAVADITAVCMLMRELSPDEVVASPVHVGCGSVTCAHGTLPVPAPATAFLLKGVPIYGGSVRGELCTPTGAALLRHFVTRFGDMPVMRTQAIGYGMGKKDFESANCVRAMLGETGGGMDDVVELSCNVDDMTAEEIGFAVERMFEFGAVDVYTIPAGMKKSRPGTIICALCREHDREQVLRMFFRYTTTIGVRESMVRRYVLERRMETLQTPYGEVRRKVSSGYGVARMKYEYDDLSRIAREQGMSLSEVRGKIVDGK